MFEKIPAAAFQAIKFLGISNFYGIFSYCGIFPDLRSTFQENQFHGISTRFVFFLFVCPLEPFTKAPLRDQTYDQTEHKQDYKSFFRNKEMYNRYVGPEWRAEYKRIIYMKQQKLISNQR